MNNAQLTCTARHVIACACHTSLERTKRIAKGSLRYRRSFPLMSKCCKKAKADLEGLGLDVRQALAVSRRCGVCAAQGVSQLWDHVNSEHCQLQASINHTSILASTGGVVDAVRTCGMALARLCKVRFSCTRQHAL